ncbi:MAG: PD-(D/E)XK nuclease family protein [Cyanobacteria bacterium J06554_6]
MRLSNQTAFASAALGTALHAALAQLYQDDWHYQEPLPSEAWLRYCWDSQIASLTDKQTEEGWQILQRYWDREIMPLGVMKRPLATEGRVQGLLQTGNIEFNLTGRYDRLDLLDDGLELIDYKSAKHPTPPSPDEVDLQLGLYHLALEQHYGRSLRRMTLLYLRTDERITYEASLEHRQQVIAVIDELAQQLLTGTEWQPNCGEQCSQCAYARYCPAVQPQPEPLTVPQKPRKLQLCLGL